MHHALLRLFKRLWTSAFLGAVLAVLAPHAHAAYTINADGTVTDSVTHLVWDRCVLGLSSNYFACDSGTAQTFTWAQALAEVQARNAANHLGHRDWRLPNANELLSLVDPNASASAYTTIDATAFPRTPFFGDKWDEGLHWTSTTLASNPVFAWTISFRGGYNGANNKTLYNAFVRLVRGGAFDSLGDTTAPVTTAGPVVSSGPTQNSAIVSVTLNEGGTGHWLVVPGTTATPPTSAQVMAGTSYGSVTVVAADRVTLSAHNPGLIYVFGLNPTSTYTLYFAAIDDSFNLQATPSSLTFTTATPVDGVCGSAHQNPVPATTAPSTALCSAGDASSVTESISAYSWYCMGTNGGADSGTCSTGRGYTVTPNAGTHGSISPSTPQVMAYNQSTSFDLVPDIGYTASASGCGGSLVGSRYTTAAATADCAVTPLFTANTYAITPSVSPLAGGSVSCSPNPVSHGSTATCTATPNTGYTFSAWSGDCTGTGACNLNNVTSAKAVTAQFTLNTYAVTPTASPLAGGSVSCSPNPVSHGSTATCTATPNAGYTFGSWSGHCTGTGACSLSNVTGTRAVTAQFTLNTYAVTAAASPLAGGSVSCSPNPVSHGSNATCTAAPNTGYTFSAWSGDCTGTGACSLNNVTSAKAVTAQFTLNTYAITATASPLAGGSVSCSPNPVSHGSTATCTATPSTGYTFGSWSGDCTGTGACSLSNVTGTRAATAQFIPVVNGACGSAANTSSAFTPASANLCASNGGTASAVSAGTSAWSWSCAGSSNGGTHASCSAPFASVPGTNGVVGSIQAASTNGWQIDTANSGFVNAPSAAPAGVTLSGVTQVKLTNGTPGSQATVVLHFSSIPPGAQLYKYGKETGPGDTPKWFAFPATIDRNAGTVTYVLTDGQKGDNDWDATNGVIDDPVGLGVGVSGVPTLSEWALWLLVGLMGALAWGQRQRR